MSSVSVSDLARHWAGRLRRFRSGDFAEAKALLSRRNGVAIMNLAIAQYLEDWANSDWVDVYEIESLARDLADIWPHEGLDLPSASTDGSRAKYSAMFASAFANRRSEMAQHRLAAG